MNGSCSTSPTSAYDILVCSTIIENGLDIPNVNTMIVNDAPQFGLSQLYQLRGRIGRGTQARLCLPAVQPERTDYRARRSGA